MARLSYVVSPVNQLGNAVAQERFTLSGNLSSPALAPWLEQRAAKLGLSISAQHRGADMVEFNLKGPVALLDAFEVACLLGPADAWIQGIERRATGQA